MRNAIRCSACVWSACFAVVVLLAAGCASPPPAPRPDPVLERAATAAEAAYAEGHFDAARVEARGALDRARALDDAAAIARATCNYAAALAAAGRRAEARALLAAERPALTRCGYGPAGDLLAARLARDAGDAVEAARLAEAAAAAPGDDGPGAERLRARLLAIDLHVATGGVAAASAAWAQVNARVARSGDADLRAEAAGTEARVGEARARSLAAVNAERRTPPPGPAAAEAWRQAARCGDARVAWLKKAGRVGEIAPALATVARDWQAAGSPREAADRFFRAAQAWAGAGNAAAAQAAVKAASALAVSTGEEDLTGRIRELEREMATPSAHAGGS